MPELLDPELDLILEGTSRSFYLTLKVLPSGIRPQVGLLYLLARTSDTIADSEGGPSDQRLQALEPAPLMAMCNLSVPSLARAWATARV